MLHGDDHLDAVEGQEGTQQQGGTPAAAGRARGHAGVSAGQAAGEGRDGDWGAGPDSAATPPRRQARAWRGARCGSRRDLGGDRLAVLSDARGRRRPWDAAEGSVWD
ncbi:hypothetical protein GCM10023074_07080 [Microbispora amethystogenes]|uniref:Uncharacterized protein n=1 Tax=Microbispora amethystogenes TaxID=1427754 RepID=A0ABQ4FEG8_9ACTN|nr:hypothetical protein Mam01_33650 [Microbispora amethystogenes]